VLGDISSSHVAELECLLLRHHLIINASSAQVRDTGHWLDRLHALGGEWESRHVIGLVFHFVCFIKSLLLLSQLPGSSHLFDLLFGLLLCYVDQILGAFRDASLASFF
jgi:hypothetical protein